MSHSTQIGQFGDVPQANLLAWCGINSQVIHEERGQATACGQCFVFPSVLWHCWFGDSEDIQPVMTCVHISNFRNRWRMKNRREPAKQGAHEKQPLKRS